MRRIAVPPGGFQRIAVLRLSSLGDVILALPTVHALRAAYPTARLVFWTKEEYADVVRFDPAISHVRALERDARRIEDVVSMSAELEECDLIVDLHANVRTRVLAFRQRGVVLRAPSRRLARERWVHARWTRPAPAPSALERYEAALAPLGLRTDRLPVVHCGGEAERWAQGWMSERGLERAVAIAPAARHATKGWPEPYWLDLVDRLSGAGHAVIAFSLAAERRSLPELSSRLESGRAMAWCTEPLPRMGALLSHCLVAVTCDSGLMHLAAARGLRVAALFGSTAPELGFAPAGAGHAALCRHERCQPCTLHGRERCPLHHFRCMMELHPEQVWTALAALLA